VSNVQWFAFLVSIAFFVIAIVIHISTKESRKLISNELADAGDTSRVWRSIVVTDVPALVLAVSAFVFALFVIFLFFIQ
jgi:hypothetical protein